MSLEKDIATGIRNLKLLTRIFNSPAIITIETEIKPETVRITTILNQRPSPPTTNIKSEIRMQWLSIHSVIRRVLKDNNEDEETKVNAIHVAKSKIEAAVLNKLSIEIVLETIP